MGWAFGIGHGAITAFLRKPAIYVAIEDKISKTILGSKQIL